MELQAPYVPDSLCKGCAGKVHISQHQIERVLASLVLKGFECVDDEEYQRRLRSCMQCQYLLDSNTCRHCGCIVQVRAKMAEKHCPLPGTPLW